MHQMRKGERDSKLSKSSSVTGRRSLLTTSKTTQFALELDLTHDSKSPVPRDLVAEAAHIQSVVKHRGEGLASFI